MPDIEKLLWPKSVAVVGASSDTSGLRGRIFEVIRSHPFAGEIYPVSRSAAEVQGLKAYPSVSALPQPVDLAILIVPADYVPAEIERCGLAGVKAAVILSSGFAEEPGETGARLQREIAATARRYDMAVSGPNAEGFANIAAALCATFSPAMDKNAGPLKPVHGLGRGQVSVISQSGGLGFAFFDRARSRNLNFRYIVTTGNEAVLETSDFVDYMLDEGKTDVFLLLLEAVKTPEKFVRMAEKALQAGKPLIVRKIGQSGAGSRAVASHTAALAGSQAAYRAIFERYGLIEGGDFDEMIDMPPAFSPAATACQRAIASASARRPAAAAYGWPTPAPPSGSTCRCSTVRRALLSTFICHRTAPRRTRSIPPPRACTKSATRNSPGWWLGHR